ncbi:hypothetical protein KAU11_09360 [Candidatus Babeliales bacterium]|nr:hypothetical protein [Candidatus Babeliales bacterium]
MTDLPMFFTNYADDSFVFNIVPNWSTADKNQFEINTTDVISTIPVSYTSDLSAQYTPRTLPDVAFVT